MRFRTKWPTDCGSSPRLRSSENISSTRGQHFPTPKSNLPFVKKKPKNLHSKGKPKHLLIIHSSDFIFKRSLPFSYGNSGFYKQRCPQFHLYCVQYDIAIFTVERTLISEWSVCFKFLMKLTYTLVKNHNNPSISWLCSCSCVFLWGLGNESISPLHCNWHLHLKWFIKCTGVDRWGLAHTAEGNGFTGVSSVMHFGLQK